jgi:AcrR family transcriptional regulator
VTPDPSRPPLHLPPALSKIADSAGEPARSVVQVNQRARILVAALDLFGTDGYRQTGIPRLVREAATSQTTFYALFADKARCFAETYDLALGLLEEAARAGAAGAGSWPLQVRAATASVLELLASDPRLARLCAVEVHFVGGAVEERRRDLVGLLAAALGPGRAGRSEARKLPCALEPALLGAATGLIAEAVQGEETETLGRHAPDLCEWLLAFYLGPAQARRIARGRRRRSVRPPGRSTPAS